jgi:hypothetical protein
MDTRDYENRRFRDSIRRLRGTVRRMRYDWPLDADTAKDFEDLTRELERYFLRAASRIDDPYFDGQWSDWQERWRSVAREGVRPDLRLIAAAAAGSALDLEVRPISELLAEITIYLDVFDNDAVARVEGACFALSGLLGYDGFELIEYHRASIWERLRGKTNEAASSDVVRRHASEIDQALSNLIVGKQQVEVDGQAAEVIATLTASVSDVANACIRAGSVMLVKFTPPGSDQASLLIRSLSPLELRALEQNPGIQRDPASAIEMLAVTVQALEGGHAD